jgi:hypothetical protein
MSGAVGNERAPLAFKVLVAAAALYLLVRFIQIGAWVVDRIL